MHRQVRADFLPHDPLVASSDIVCSAIVSYDLCGEVLNAEHSHWCAEAMTGC